jgi:hypothetical protein
MQTPALADAYNIHIVEPLRNFIIVGRGRRPFYLLSQPYTCLPLCAI